MPPHAESLLRELANALSALGMTSDADEIMRFKDQLGSSVFTERQAAAKHISDRCHVKWYGNLNLPIQRPGRHPVYVFLDEVRNAVAAEAE